MMRLLCASAVLFVALSARAVDIVGAMRPNADLTVYFDTKQAERAMSPEIWKQIQADKKKASLRSSKEKTFNTEGRDVVGCINVDFPAFDPFQLRLDGVLSVSGGKNASAKRDVRDFATAFRELGYEVTVSGDKKKPSCKVNMLANEEFPDSGAELVSEDDATLRLKARWGLKEEQAAAATQKESRLADLLASDPVKDSSFVLVGDARTLAKLPLDGSGIQRTLKILLLKLAAFRVSGVVRGDALALRADLRFLDEKDAAECRNVVKVNGSELSASNGLAVVRSFSCGGEGGRVLVAVELDIKTAWEVLGRFEMPAAKRKGQQKKNKAKKN